MSWHLLLVGTPAIEGGGRTVPLPVERRGQLVALLALRGDWMQRAEVAALLWPDVPQSLASTNLRKAVFRARDAHWGGCIESEGTALRVVATHDVSAFHSAVRDGRLAHALAQTRGQLLAGFDDDGNEAWTGWLRVQRERWAAAWRAAALDRLAQDVPAEEALRLADALLQDDPQDEAALHAQLTHLAAQGQHARARELYREFAQRMQQDLGLAPGDALRALHEQLRQQPLPAAPQPTATDGGYIGRVFEQRRIAELMQRPDCRLLAIVGPGGMGKTRLARRALESLAPLFADGAVFVPLEDVSDAAAMPSRLARALGLKRSGARDGAAALVEHLQQRSLLLVLDNFEQLAADGTSLLEQLLEGAPRLKLLVTSRERLRSAMQWALPLDGLPCPEPEDADRLDAFDAARLFIAAARRADPTFDPRAEQHAIIDICRQVDGLPLALEMAAAWTRVMRCDGIARELRQGSELLRATNPGFPARQASVEAVFDQSWRLLAARERAALARLSVFRGGFTVEAARSAAGAPLAVQGALLDKSLLQKNGARLGLHPLLQQFAALRLAEGPEDEAAARAAHAEHFRWFLDAQMSGARRGHADALQAIDDDFENCCLAWQWLAAHGPAAALAGPARALSDHADHRGQPQRGLALLRQALAGPVAAGDAPLRARLLALIAHLSYRSERFADAAETALQALDGAGEADVQTRQFAHQVIASAALRQGRLDDARQHFQAVLDLSDGTTRGQDRAATLDHLSLVEKRLGRFDEALRLSLEALREHRQLDDPAGTALCLNNLATIYFIRDELDAAEAPLREALALCERAGLATTHVLVLTNLCEVALNRQAWDAAEDLADRGIELAASSNQRMVFGWLHALKARLATVRADPVTARTALVTAAEVGLQLDLPTIKAVVALEFARLLHAEGHAAAAGQALLVAIGDARLGAGEQDRLRGQRLAWVPDGDPGVPPPISLDAMLHRIASEAGQRHAALATLLAG
ncbi:MAG TPA: tetratricopeptide repeat protein [Rubrivivax sp.]|nr:tetratricopeptide repeat protein [Rubrivivax sp.]